MLSHVSAELSHLPAQELVGTTLGMGRHELCSQIVGAGMKAQAGGSCPPPPTCCLSLDKTPKPTKKPKGNQAGGRGSTCRDLHLPA